LLDPKKTFLRAAAEMEIGDVEDLISTAPPQAAPVDPAKMADVQHKNNKLQVDAATEQSKNATDMEIKKLELQNNEADRVNKLQLAQLAENTERLRLASTIAIHSDKMDEAQRGANIKLISDHVGMAVKHGHELDKMDQTQGHELNKDDIAHQQAAETADVAHERAKDMAEHTAKLAPKKGKSE
jgi:signal transduction histidine kinase